MNSARTPKLPCKVVPRVKVWLEVDGNYAFGLGISAILKAIEQTGSIKEAATVVGKSYRHVWSRIKEAEAALGATLVETHVGGKDSQRSGLTPLARRLVANFDALRERMLKSVGEEYARFEQAHPPRRR